jgi:hypothetical protein
MNCDSDLSLVTESAKVTKPSGVTRRQAIISGGVGSILAAGVFPNLKLRANEWSSLPMAPRFTPFTRSLPIPGRLGEATLDPVPGCAEACIGSQAVYHGTAPEFQPDHPTPTVSGEIYR